MEEMKKELKKKQKSELEDKWDKGYKTHWVKFHQPISPAPHKEPVYELHTKSSATKYSVDDMRWIWGEGVIIKAYGEIHMSPDTNVADVRFSL